MSRAWVLAIVAFACDHGDKPLPAGKPAEVAALLAHGPVIVTVDTRHGGVVVPPASETDACWELRLDPAHTTLDATAIHTGATVVPWPAVYEAENETAGELHRWKADAPLLDDGMVTDATWVATTAAKRTTVAHMAEIRATRIYLDARRPDVIVPDAHKTDPMLVLRIGYKLAPPIADLKIDDAGVSGTMQFAGKRFLVAVPWPAIYGAVIEGYGRGWQWPNDMPPDAPTK